MSPLINSAVHGVHAPNHILTTLRLRHDITTKLLSSGVLSVRDENDNSVAHI